MGETQLHSTEAKADDTPLRLQLGEDAVDAIKVHAKQLLADLETWRAVALDTAF